MAVTVKSATLWRREVENRPGALASTLEPLAKARVDLRVVMGYRLPALSRVRSSKCIRSLANAQPRRRRRSG
jgi:hypothetical protein